MIEELYERFPIMEKLKEERVFHVEEDGEDKIMITENCDDWFSVEISKQDAKEISDFFLVLSESMKS